MSHEVETMMFHGASPWHGIGTRVDHLATAKEAIIAAGMDWLVEAVPIYTNHNQLIEGYKAIQRVTDGLIYCVTSDRYKPFQNWEAFQFFDKVTGTGLAKYETAGALRKGAVIFILANLGNLGIAGEQVNKYCVLTTGHDAQHALKVFWTPVRVVCMNTLRMALQGADSVYHKHTESITTDAIRDAQVFLGLASTFYGNWSQQAERLATLALPAPQQQLLLSATFGSIPADMIGATKWVMTKQRVEELVEVGKGMDNPKVKGTRWGWYNAIAQHVDYDMYPNKDKDKRLEKVWFGDGERVKERAWEHLTGTL